MNRVAHASGKTALNMLTQTMALELAQHVIKVSAIAPGYTLMKKVLILILLLKIKIQLFISVHDVYQYFVLIFARFQ